MGTLLGSGPVWDSFLVLDPQRPETLQEAQHRVLHQLVDPRMLQSRKACPPPATIHMLSQPGECLARYVIPALPLLVETFR